MAHSYHPPGLRRWLRQAPLVLLCLLAGSLAHAATAVDVDIHGVNDELQDNVRAYLSFERYKKGGADLTPDTIERLHDRVEREVESALRPYGYYEPKVESSVTQEGGTWKVRIDITPGAPVLVQHIDVHVEGPGESDPLFQRILSHLPLKAGDILNQRSYEGIKNDLQRTAATYGYFDAQLTVHELVVDPPSHKANISLQMETGERYHFGVTTIKQRVVKDSLVRRYLRYRQGEPYDLTQVLRTQFALDDAQYFANLEVLPGKPDPATLTVPVNISADASRRHRYSIGAGYATDTGARGTLGFDDHRINSSGHSFSVEVQAAQVTKYSLQARYTIPVGDPAVENFSMRGSIVQHDWGDLTSTTASIGPAFTAVTGGWQHVWLVNAVHTKSYPDNPLVETEYPPGSQTDQLLVPELDIASVPKGYLGEPLFERPLFIEIKGSHASLGSNSNFAQVHVQGERVFNWNWVPKWHLLLRGEVGATLASEFSQLPVAFRFFAGGDNSVRGFGYADLSPTQLTTVCATYPVPAAGCPVPPGNIYIKVGGKDVITGTVEVVRDLPKSLGLATFFDYGNAFDSWSDATRLAYSVGVGLRVRLSVLTLGIDIAKPLYEPCPQGEAPLYGRSSCTPGGLRLHINFSPKL